jgi:hypothetical protein
LEENMSKIHVESTTKGWSTVHLTGELSVDEVAQTADVYEDLYSRGVRRVMVDARKTSTDYKNLFTAQQKLHQALGKFEKISLLVEDARNAFNLKTLAVKNPKAHVAYTIDDATNWLQSP